MVERPETPSLDTLPRRASEEVWKEGISMGSLGRASILYTLYPVHLKSFSVLGSVLCSPSFYR